MRYVLIVLCMLFGSLNLAGAQVSIGIALPGVRIGFNLPLYPDLVQVPGYPVYYAPRVDANYFFYDGLYWLYQSDDWYASSWYNGPWGRVAPEVVPLFVLRVPVRYYRHPPAYFRGWRPDAPPRWGQHWGNDWERRRSGWDRWNRASAPTPAPLPVYQRQYARDRYPQVDQQRALHDQNYRYQPRDAVVRRHYQDQGAQRRTTAPAQPQQQTMPPRERSSRPQEIQRSSSQRQGDRDARREQPQHRGGDDARDSAPSIAPSHQRGQAVENQRQRQGAAQREQQTPTSSQENIRQGRGSSQERGKGQDKGRGNGKDEERGQDRNR